MTVPLANEEVSGNEENTGGIASPGWSAESAFAPCAADAASVTARNAEAVELASRLATIGETTIGVGIGLRKARCQNDRHHGGGA